MGIAATTVDHPLLGTVELHVRSAARRFVARWKDGRVVLTVPPGGMLQAAGVLDAMAPRLLARRPQPRLVPGTVIRQPGICIEIVSDPARPGIRAVGTPERATVLLGSGCDPDAPGVQQALRRVLMRIAADRAPAVLLPLAEAVARELGAHPRAFQVSRGLRTLGSCNSRGVIRLSAALMFAPEHLRRYVVCHELAHLRELNHSPRFHAICDAYCGGHAASLAAELRRFFRN